MSIANHIQNVRIDNNNKPKKDVIKLSEEQILMLKLSDEDIKVSKLIPQSQLDKHDLKWLKGLVKPTDPQQQTRK